MSWIFWLRALTILFGLGNSIVVIRVHLGFSFIGFMLLLLCSCIGIYIYTSYLSITIKSLSLYGRATSVIEKKKKKTLSHAAAAYDLPSSLALILLNG